MKVLSIRETRLALTRLEALLAKHGQIVIQRRGKPIARIEAAEGPRRLPPLDDFRARQPLQTVPSETLIREDRDSR